MKSCIYNFISISFVTLGLLYFYMPFIFHFRLGYFVQVEKAHCGCPQHTVRVPMRTKINTEMHLNAGDVGPVCIRLQQTTNKWKWVSNKSGLCGAHSKWVEVKYPSFRYRTIDPQWVTVCRSVTCLRLLLRLSAHYNNNPVYSRPFPARMFRTWVAELLSHGRPSPCLYSSACSALPGTLNTSPWSCFLVHSPSLRTYCRWFTPVLGPRPAPQREGERRDAEKNKLSKSERGADRKAFTSKKRY